MSDLLMMTTHGDTETTVFCQQPRTRWRYI